MSVTNDEIDQAIRYVNKSRDTHVQWIDFLDVNPNWKPTDNDCNSAENTVGGTDHHQECIDRYDYVIETLERARNGN